MFEDVEFSVPKVDLPTLESLGWEYKDKEFHEVNLQTGKVTVRPFLEAQTTQALRA